LTLADIAASIKHTFPFALGSTSYVIAADVVTNVRAIAPIVDDIELILFESPGASNMLTDKEIHTLCQLANEHGITYTVHLPIQHRAAAADPSERLRYVTSAQRVIETCRCLEPRAWIMHLEGVPQDASPSERESWTSRSGESLQAIANAVSCPGRLAVENLGYPWHWHETLAFDFGIDLCCDVGHLWLYFPDDWLKQVEGMLPRTSVIHLHGVSKGHDHISLRRTHSKDTWAFLDCLHRLRYTGVVTLEMFNEEDFAQSVQIVRDIWESLLCQP